MLKREIRPALEALRKIKMPKIEDKEIRNALIKNHFTLLGEAKKYDATIEDLRTVHLGPYEEELQNMQELQNKLQVESDPAKRAEMVNEINSHKDLLDAINGFNKAVFDLEKEEITLVQIEGEKFSEEYANQDYDMSVVEALYPMFK